MTWRWRQEGANWVRDCGHVEVRHTGKGTWIVFHNGRMYMPPQRRSGVSLDEPYAAGSAARAMAIADELFPVTGSLRCLRCPECGHKESRVLETRDTRRGRRRRRKCTFCDHRYTTHETAEETSGD